MSRCLASATLTVGTLAALCVLSACADAGLPWGWVEVEVQARFDPDEGRIDEEGRLKTSGDFALTLDEVEASFDALTVVLAGAGAADFDPANPPEGYSLCHNGHCHSDSGALVDYEVIALEIAGGTAGARVTVGLDDEPAALSAASVDVDAIPCEAGPCDLPRGELSGLELTLASLWVSGTAFDRLTGDKARLPPEGVAFEAAVEVPTAILAQLAGSIGPGEPVGLNLGVGFALPPELFDDIDFSQSPSGEGPPWQDLLVAALEEHSALEVSVTRTNP